MDRKYLMAALGYGIIGVVLGIYMAASKDHGQLVTHAHIMLVGMLVSFVYAVIYKLWLTEEQLLKRARIDIRLTVISDMNPNLLQYGRCRR